VTKEIQHDIKERPGLARQTKVDATSTAAELALRLAERIKILPLKLTKRTYHVNVIGPEKLADWQEEYGTVINGITTRQKGWLTWSESLKKY
jgi:hypothetical protein